MGGVSLRSTRPGPTRAPSSARHARRQPHLESGRPRPRVRGHARPPATGRSSPPDPLRPRPPGGAVPGPRLPRVSPRPHVRAGGERGPVTAGQRVEDLWDPLARRRAHPPRPGGRAGAATGDAARPTRRPFVPATWSSPGAISRATTCRPGFLPPSWSSPSPTGSRSWRSRSAPPWPPGCARRPRRSRASGSDASTAGPGAGLGHARRDPAAGRRSRVVLTRWLAGHGFESVATCLELEAYGRTTGVPVITGDCVSPVLARVCGMHLAHYHAVAKWGTGLEPEDPTIMLDRSTWRRSPRSRPRSSCVSSRRSPSRSNAAAECCSELGRLRTAER